MNFNDWLKKYYPVPANEVKGTELDYINHSILKWEGLRDCRDYGLSIDENSLFEDEDKVFRINGESCALCVNYYDKHWNGFEYEEVHPCTRCPLAKILGKPCDDDNDDDDENNYSLYDLSIKNPQLMIDELKKAQNWWMR